MVWYLIITFSQIVGIREGCDQNGERVSEKDESCHICIIRLRSVLVRYEKYGILSIKKSMKSYSSENSSSHHNFVHCTNLKTGNSMWTTDNI